MAVSCLTPSRFEGTPGGALWFTNSGEQSSSMASMLPPLCTSSTKRRTRALLCSADMLLSSLYSCLGAALYVPTHDAIRHDPTRTFWVSDKPLFSATQFPGRSLLGHRVNRGYGIA